MRPAAICSLLSLLLFSFASMSKAAISPSEYRASLLEIYGRFQGVLALRDACNTAFPQTRGETDKAFKSWQTRYKKSHDELDQRISLMIRAYSKDDKDYARNFGKYQGAFLKQREESKQVLLENRGDLEIRCKGLPHFLQSRESDLEAEFANEWLVLRQWQMPEK
jgi:hypothetical protein